MPEPVPAPTAIEIVTVADIIQETTDSVVYAIAVYSQEIADAK